MHSVAYDVVLSTSGVLILLPLLWSCKMVVGQPLPNHHDKVWSGTVARAAQVGGATGPDCGHDCGCKMYLLGNRYTVLVAHHLAWEASQASALRKGIVEHTWCRAN